MADEKKWAVTAAIMEHGDASPRSVRINGGLNYPDANRLFREVIANGVTFRSRDDSVHWYRPLHVAIRGE